MLGLILLYFAGKAFYDLAGIHNRSRWGYAILGLVSYYGGQFLAALVIVLAGELGYISIDGLPDLVIDLMALPFGVLSCWGTYKYLENRWSSQSAKTGSEEVLDGDLLNRE